MMKRQTAAQYCDMSVAAFEREVFAGRLPSAILLGGRDHWDRRALDKALDLISGNVVDDAEQRFWTNGKAA